MMRPTKKYELTDIRHPQHPTTKQIRAIRDIPLMGIKKGAVGGFVETEYNLSQTDESWIGPCVVVKEQVRVMYDSYIRGVTVLSGICYIGSPHCPPAPCGPTVIVEKNKSTK